jgi:predicted ATPase
VLFRSIQVQRLKLLRDFTLDFRNPDGSRRMWTVIIGENGTAKTSLLQATALAAAGPALVNALATPIVGHLRDRRTTGTMEVAATFAFSKLHQRRRDLHPMLPTTGIDYSAVRLRSELELGPKSSTITGSSVYLDANDDEMKQAKRGDPLDRARALSSHLWFVAAYGVGRFLPSPAESPRLDRPPIERMESLFGHSSTLTSLRFLDHFDETKARRFSRLLRDTLTHAESLVPDLQGIELRGKGGVKKAGDLIDKDRFTLRVGTKNRKVPAVALSHGYQSTIAWVADLIGHVMLEADTAIQAKDIEGLVLIDEIDLYLHPQWQVGLITALRTTFPKVQFIVTTHSPVVLSAFAPSEVVRVKQHPKTGDVERAFHHPETGELVVESMLEGMAPVQPDPRMMTGTDLYRDWFGVDRLILNPNGKELRQYTRIARDPLRHKIAVLKLGQLRTSLRKLGLTELPSPVPRLETPVPDGDPE